MRHVEHSEAGRRRVRQVSVAVFFVLALAATWGLRAWRVAHVADATQEQQEERVAEVLRYVEEQFNQRQRALLARAKALAETQGVVRALRRLHNGGSEALVRRFADLDLPERQAVGLYDTTQTLVAWNGYSMPLDEGPATPRFLETFQTIVAEDGAWRQALVVWYPVRDGVRALGAVRMMEMLYAHAPVKNDYLRDYRIADTWQRRTGLTVTARFGPPFIEQAPDAGQARLLQGLDGTVLGRVVVEPPSAGRVVEATRTRYDDVLAFWLTLLLFWAIAELWVWHRRLDEQAVARRTTLAAGGRLVLVAAAWWGVRYLLLELDVPARWQRGKAPLNPLFDPTHLASTFGGGLLRSTGDFFLTAVFALLFALAFLRFAARFRQRAQGYPRSRMQLPAQGASPWRFFAGLSMTVLLGFGLTLLLAVVTRHAILDSTLDFFSREGLFPRSLVLLIFCTLLLFTLAVVVLIVGLTWMGTWQPAQPAAKPWPRWAMGLGVALATGGPLLVLYLGFDVERLVPWPLALAFLAVGVGVAAFGRIQSGSSLGLLTLRSVLPAIFGLSILLYPMVYTGLDAQRRLRMQDAAESFGAGSDPGVVFAIRQVLDEAQHEPTLPAALTDTVFVQRRRAYLDSLATVMLRGSLLASLSTYDVSLLFLDAAGRPVGRYDASDRNLSRPVADEIDAEQFGTLRQMYAERSTPGIMVEQMTGRLESDRFQYAGVVPVRGPEEQRLGWIMARAEPHTLLQEGSTPFLRVLLPAGSSNLYASLSLAAFRDGVLLRSLGRDFGRYRLDEAVRRTLQARPEVWLGETVKERRFLTYYRRVAAEALVSPLPTPVEQKVVAVRVPAIATFDHLYYLLRLTVAGLLVGLPFYVLGLYLRRQAGLLPAPRVRFRDKVLNAFLVVGIIAIGAVGFIGVNVVTGENERAVQSWLRQHLDRVEETLALDAQGDEMPYRVLDRVSLDSVAAQVGLDLNLYQGARLIRSSRPQLIRERLIDVRLPIQAHQALYLDGYQFTFVEEQLGTFTYTAGYRALLDEQGQPAYVVSVPTLPEEERIEEERARTVAYLFGALLMLVVLVMVTASLMANALARPIARLRVGLEDVAQGRFERKLPVDTRDEIGELVQTFNVMQEQLAESRRKLAQQERQLAWREMARQVAHEIKNPLTPMKLSVQHLRRAYDDGDGTGDEAARNGRFARLFKRITGTLVEQIDTLARIADEFSTFARMPTRMLERLDLNDVVQEAVALMQAEAGTEIDLDLTDAPLVVEADREELRRVFINLIKNALQALPDEEGRVTVAAERRAAPGGDVAYGTVTDTGTGIPPDLRDKIFEPNFSTKTSGTGLGLAIARKSVEEAGGEIGFETEEGVGTTFWIRLPLP